ncbi:MAG TPA: DUF6079 family protein [Pyrinomonadaceae bacterium]
MKRIQEKIKDLIEPHAYDAVRDFAAEPARALAAYRFTDMTSDLLARWVDALSSVGRGRGAAHALAGARGVGKSHTLAVFGAIACSESLARAVDDAHVATTAQRLARRRFAVVRVERGTRATLQEEMAAGFARALGGGESQWTGDPREMLAVAASRDPEATLVVLVDTASTRPSRVSRDDGPLLGEMAAATRGTAAFVALALDDDIAGADGANVALSGTYRIDYLGAEHLYHVADQHVLCKKPQARSAIHEIYSSLRATVSGFNWSESRFALLYPVHPLIADVASAVRLYVPHFSFLPFAASVARHAAGRPALSLVLLDELFDGVESDLRKSTELRGAFAAYDHLLAESVERLPVMQRYQARLLLKSLFILSLDGRGATARELCAALLLPDDDAQVAGQVAETLERFTGAALPASLQVGAREGDAAAANYRFRLDATEAQVPALEGDDEAHEAAVEQDAPEREDDDAAQAGRASTGSSSAADLLNDLESEGLFDPPGVSASTGANASAEAEATASEAKDAEAPNAEAANAEPTATNTTDVRATDEEAASAGTAQAGTTEASADATEACADVAAPVAREASKVEPVIESVRAVTEDERRDPEELTEWARYLTEQPSLGSITDEGGREVIREALSAWLRKWRGLELEKRIEALPDAALNTRVWDLGRLVRRRFDAAAEAVEAALAEKTSLEEGLVRASEAFDRSPGKLASAARHLADLRDYVNDFAPTERVRAYLATAEPTGVERIEAARRELLSIAADAGALLERERRERLRVLWREFHTHYVEHYAALHDKTMACGDREEFQSLTGGDRWREFEALSRLTVVSAQPRRRVEELLERERAARCALPVRRLLETQPSCACAFRLSRAAEFERLARDLEESVEGGIEVYRRTLLLMAGHLAIALDALARKEEDAESARRARSLSTAFAQKRLPERFALADVRFVERALKRTQLPPVRVAAPNGENGALTRDQLRTRLDGWLDELPEQPVLIELIGKETHAP